MEGFGQRGALARELLLEHVAEAVVHHALALKLDVALVGHHGVCLDPHLVENPACPSFDTGPDPSPHQSPSRLTYATLSYSQNSFKEITPDKLGLLPSSDFKFLEQWNQSSKID